MYRLICLLLLCLPTTVLAAELPTAGVVAQVARDGRIVLQQGDSLYLIGCHPLTLAKRSPQHPLVSYLREALLGKQVTLTYDQRERDHRGVLLAYVWLRGTLVNVQAVQHGLVRALLFPPNTHFTQQLLAAEKVAEQQAVGLWEEHTLQGQLVRLRYRAYPEAQHISEHPGLRTSTGQVFALWKEQGPQYGVSGWEKRLGTHVTVKGRIAYGKFLQAPPPPYLVIQSMQGLTLLPTTETP